MRRRAGIETPLRMGSLQRGKERVVDVAAVGQDGLVSEQGEDSDRPCGCYWSTRCTDWRR